MAKLKEVLAKNEKLVADLAYLTFDQATRDKVDKAYGDWVKAYDAWKAEKDAEKKKPLYEELNKKYKDFGAVFPLAAPGEASVNGSSGSGSTVFIVIGVVLVLAAAVGGGLWYKKKQGGDKEGGEADDR